MARLSDTADGLIARITVHGEVPEIPNIEIAQEIGWEFRQTSPGILGTHIFFAVPDHAQEHLESVLGLYTLLYGGS